MIEEGSPGMAVSVRDFWMTRDLGRTPKFHWGARAIPVNSSYVDRLLRQTGMEVRVHETCTVGPDVALILLEESLRNLGHELLSLESIKRELLRYHALAEKLESQKSKGGG